MLIGSEGNLCVAIVHSSFTTDGPTIKPIVYSGFLGFVRKQIYLAVGLYLFNAGCLQCKRTTGEQTQSQQDGKSQL